MSKAVRLSDIAQRLGVSTVTVSKALSDKKGVSDELRARIKETAAEMNYNPNGKSTTRNGATGNIGVLIPSYFLEKGDSFYWNMYQRVVTRLAAKNYFGILEVIDFGSLGEDRLPRLLRTAKVDGIIVIGQVEKQYIQYIRGHADVPIMFLDSYDNTNGNDSIISDGYYGMYSMTNHLIHHGHKDIFYVGTVGFTSSISDRYYGFCRAMRENGLVVDESRIVPDRDAEGKIQVELPSNLPTAFACNCDITAYQVIEKLQKCGLSVPEDISVVGFDDYQLDAIKAPSITTYAVDMDNMARSCVERLLRKIHNPSYTSNLKVVSGHIIVRSSVRVL